MRKRNKRNASLPILLFVAVVALAIGGLLVAQALRQNKIDNPGEVTSQDDVPRTTAAEAYIAQKEQGAVIVDTRSESQYASQHIAGSINIPLDQLEVRMGELDKETWYITYCT